MLMQMRGRAGTSNRSSMVTNVNTKTKRKLTVIGIVIACTAFVSLLWLRQTQFNTKTFNLKDVSRPWKTIYSDRLSSLLCGSLAIKIEGAINGQATLKTPAGEVHLGPGTVNNIILMNEYWHHICPLAYIPSNVYSGSLAITIKLGSLPEWATKPIATMAPAHYSGHWTTWHPSRIQKYSEGPYYQGKKNGRWTYWNIDGKTTRTEYWEHGILTSTTQQD